MAVSIALSCNTPSKLLSDGKYEKAYRKALTDLQKDKNKRENKSTLLKAFNELVKATESNAEDLLLNQDIKYAIQAYESYGLLSNQYQEGKQWLANDYGSQMVEITQAKESVRVNIAESFWAYSQEDIEKFNGTGLKSYAQSAFENLEGYEQYGGNSPDLNKMKLDMYEAGIITINVVAEQRWGYSNDWDIDNTFDNLTRVSSKWYKLDYKGYGNNYDCLMQIELSNVAFDTDQDQFSEQFSQEIQDGYTTAVDTSGNVVQVPQTKIVTGTVTTFRTRVTGTWSADVIWQSRNGECNFRNERFNVREFEDCEYYRTYGDERAIPSQFLNQSNFNNDCDVQDDIYNELLDELYREIDREYF